MPDPDVVGTAHVQYDDFRGTDAADNADFHAPIEEMLGVDASKWKVVGIQFGSYEGLDLVAVHAVERDVYDAAGSIPGLVEQHGGRIPVTELNLPQGRSVQDVIGALFKRFQVRLTYKQLFDSDLELQEIRDL